MIIEKKKLTELKPAPYNPRKSSQEEEARLQESLQKFGVVEPVIFNKQTGYIVGGHFRVRELKKLGFTEVECVIVDLPEDQERELNIRLNANTGSWDYDVLADWNQDELKEWGLDLDLKKVDESKDGDSIDIKKSLQVLPKKEYIIIIADDGSDEWEELKTLMSCGLVRQGGCKIGSTSDKATTGLERVFDFKTFKDRITYGIRNSNSK